jgi:uncharacterized protein (TIGR02246 family)
MPIASYRWLVAVLLWLLSAGVATSGQTEDANALLDQWSAAYTANDPEAVANKYWPDAILLGTVSPIVSIGHDAILKYFTAVKDSGNKNAIQERHVIAIDDNAVLVTGFYEFTRMQDGNPVPAPCRYTMLVTKRGGEWRITHHHSSPRAQAKQ